MWTPASVGLLPSSLNRRSAQVSQEAAALTPVRKENGGGSETSPWPRAELVGWNRRKLGEFKQDADA